ncbi:MAG: T9SS type A sorting domain-containing protein [Ferruginibacter sp.]
MKKSFLIILTLATIKPVNAQLLDFQNAIYYTASGTTLTATGLSLSSFNFNSSSPSDPLFNNGIYFSANDYLGNNLWIRVRHIAADPNGQNVGYNVPATASNPCQAANMLGGWNGFLYDFEIYQDVVLNSTRTNELGALFPVGITVASLERLFSHCGTHEWVSFSIKNSGASPWNLDATKFTGENPNSLPAFSSLLTPVNASSGCSPAGYTTTFPSGDTALSAISVCPVFPDCSEFKMSAGNVSHFQYGYEADNAGAYQGFSIEFGIHFIVTPLNLLLFKAQVQTNNISLQWQAANEINTSHFFIQRSNDGVTFNSIARVEAKNTGGNNNYSLLDTHPTNGINFYRLQIVDKDGKTTYSQIIKITLIGKNVLQLFPNPATKFIALSGLENKGAIRIIASEGKLIKQLPATANSMLIDISILAKGLYMLQYNSAERLEQIKFLKE